MGALTSTTATVDLDAAAVQHGSVGRRHVDAQETGRFLPGSPKLAEVPDDPLSLVREFLENQLQRLDQEKTGLRRVLQDRHGVALQTRITYID